MNYKVKWIGIVEGYKVVFTDDPINDYDVFRTFREAKKEAVQKALNDSESSKRGYKRTKQFTKSEVYEE